MNKKHILTFFIIALLLLASAWSINVLKNGSSYLLVLKLNWGITLPSGCELTYQAEGEPGILGDGGRYHILTYHKSVSFPSEISERTVSEKEREVISNLLTNLSVKGTEYPPFARITHGYLTKREDSSVLYMLYSQELKTLYVIEDFY